MAKTYVYEWPEGQPMPDGAVDGMAELIEGDDGFKYSEHFDLEAWWRSFMAVGDEPAVNPGAKE